MILLMKRFTDRIRGEMTGSISTPHIYWKGKKAPCHIFSPSSSEPGVLEEVTGRKKSRAISELAPAKLAFVFQDIFTLSSFDDLLPPMPYSTYYPITIHPLYIFVKRKIIFFLPSGNG